MVRAPTRTCPNLSRLFDEAEPQLLAGFLSSKAFGRLEWLPRYCFGPDNPEGFLAARQMLDKEKKERLAPLETEAARIVTMAGPRGQFALEGLSKTTLDPAVHKNLFDQRDELARSLWAYCRLPALFDATENTLHLRLYRRYDRHYQTFAAEPSTMGGPGAESSGIIAFLKEVGDKLDRGDGYGIERFDIPAADEEPAAEMYLLYHPNPPTSVREIDDEGRRSRFYFRPPGEAMIVYVPSTGRVHVRAGTRALRHIIAETFVTTALEQPMSRQPVDFQAYDISRFLASFDLDLPDVPDAIILDAKVIRADVSIIDLATRLSLSGGIRTGIGPVLDRHIALGSIISAALAVRFIEIVVRYRRAERREELTLDFTLSDRNTSSLMSLDDPTERILGHRLLRHWGILRDGREPSAAESLAAMPALLALWDSRAETVTGSWLQTRNVDVGLLQEVGFLVPAGWEGDDLIDDEESVGPMVAQVVVGKSEATLAAAEGQAAPGTSSDRYRRYRVREGWVEQHLQLKLADTIDLPAVQRINPHLFGLGMLRIDDRDVPVWLARGLDDEQIRSVTDTDLRARSNLGIGLVLQSGRSFGSCLAANVLTPLDDHIGSEATSLVANVESLRSIFRRDRALAQGGLTVRLERSGDHAGTLFVPGAGSIDIIGANRLIVIQRLVDNHNAGSPRMKTADMLKGIEGQSLANIFKQPLWDKLKADFLRSLGPKGPWEIAT